MKNSKQYKERPSPLSPAIHLAEQIQLKSTNHKSSQQLQNKTQKTAFALLQKEEKNAIRSRLECLLVQQYLKKYGSKNPSSEINSTIRSKVNEFVNAYDDIREAEANIGALEIHVQKSIASLKTIIKIEKVAKAAEAAARVPNLGLQPNSQSAPAEPEIDRNQWPVINAIMSVAAEQEQARIAEATRLKKLKYQEELSRQIERNKQVKEQSKQQQHSDLIVVQTELSSFETEQARLRQKKEHDHRMEREMREAQIEENKRQKEQERQMRIAQEQGEMARARRIAQEEEEERRLLKMRQKQAQDDLKLENEHNKAIKADILKERQSYEKKLNVEYEAKLAREEEARQRAFQSRMDALANFSKSYESRVGSRLQQQKEENDKIINANLAESDRKRAEREKADYDRRRNTSLANTEYNITMMEKKKKAVEDERREAFERRMRMEQEAQEQKRVDREHAEKKRIQMLDLKDKLDQQVAQRHTGERNFAALSSIEATINKSITKKLAEDPQLLHKVAEKVHAVSMQSSRSETNGVAAASGRKPNNIFF